MMTGSEEDFGGFGKHCHLWPPEMTLNLGEQLRNKPVSLYLADTEKFKLCFHPRLTIPYDLIYSSNQIH